MTCAEFLDRYSEYADRLLLSQAERGLFQRHLAECAECRRYDARVRRGVIALRVLPHIEPSQDFRQALDRRLREAAGAAGRSRRGGPTLVRVAAMLLVSLALAVLAVEGLRRPAVAGPPTLEPVPFPQAVAGAAPPFVSFQDPRAVVLTGSLPLYSAAAAQRTAVYTGGDVVGR